MHRTSTTVSRGPVTAQLRNDPRSTPMRTPQPAELAYIVYHNSRTKNINGSYFDFLENHGSLIFTSVGVKARIDKGLGRGFLIVS